MCLKQQVGKNGENIVCEYLKENNYEVIEKNFRAKHREVDIIVYDKIKEELVFCEVKTRSNVKYGNPSEAVNKQKQNNIIKVAKYYSYKRKLKDVPIRFDVIEVFLNSRYYKINHIKRAFTC